ncbi:MAG: Maf family protein [Planctomycetota bacterium]
MPRLILASASPRRRQFLTNAGYNFDVVPADLDEASFQADGAEQLAQVLAREKCAAISAHFPEAVVIGADTTVAAADGTLLGKPTDRADAARIIRKLTGPPHLVATGVAVGFGDRLETSVDVARVTMRPLSDEELERYLDSDAWDGKAGAYGIQNDDPFVTDLDGRRDTVMGLPMNKTQMLLEQLGVTPVGP